MLEDAGDNAAAEEVVERAVTVGTDDDIVGGKRFCPIDNFINSKAEYRLACDVEPLGTKRRGQLLDPLLCILGLPGIHGRRGSGNDIHRGTDRNIRGHRLNDMEKNDPRREFLGQALRLLQNFRGAGTCV